MHSQIFVHPEGVQRGRIKSGKEHIDHDEKVHFLLLHPHREVLVVILELLGRGVEVGVEHLVVISDGFLKGVAGIGIKSGGVVRILLVHKALLLEVCLVLAIAVDESYLQTLVGRQQSHLAQKLVVIEHCSRNGRGGEYGVEACNAFVLELIERVALGLLVEMFQNVAGDIGDILR